MDARKHYDLFIIGGGINGCGLARDAAGRGFCVGLAEKGDLAGATSSASTKLIHGGLRYLEHYEFKLVREALQEREVIWRMAPHIVRPLRFILPYHKGLRSRWLLRAGLFIYDYLGGCTQELWRTRNIDFKSTYSNILKQEYRNGFEYSDARVDDARLVILNARDAKKRGADIHARCEVIGMEAREQTWFIHLYDHKTQQEKVVSASYLANMAGPWVSTVLSKALGDREHAPIRLVKGSHIIVRRLYDHDRAYIFQNQDGRIIFAIPYQKDFTLIGTTDCDYSGDPTDVVISEEETAYLCGAASEYFVKPIKTHDVVWHYAGVRPLYDDGAQAAQAATRDYILKEMDKGGASILNTYGGKITTYRRLAEDAMALIEKKLGTKKPAWTAKAPLPGGDFPHNQLAKLEERIAQALPELDTFTHWRLARSYGTEAFEIFSSEKEKGEHFGFGLYAVEVEWLRREEWALSVEDILWRRSKLGLYFDDRQCASLAAYLEANRYV